MGRPILVGGVRDKKLDLIRIICLLGVGRLLLPTILYMESKPGGQIAGPILVVVPPPMLTPHIPRTPPSFSFKDDYVLVQVWLL